MKPVRFLLCCCLLCCLTCALQAGEYAVLKSGFRLKADRHDVVDGVTRLHSAAGTVHIPSDQIVAFETEDYIAPPAAVETPFAQKAVEITTEELIASTAERLGLRPEFVMSVAIVESALRADAVSPKGALGLMQLMPATALELGADAKNKSQNVEAGARYLKQLLLRYQNSPDAVRLALAAYNAGPGAVAKYRGTVPPYRETQAYVEKVLRAYLKQLKSKS